MGKHGPKPGRFRERDLKIVADYKRGLTMRECAELWGLCFERIRQIISAIDPACIRPMHILPPHRRRGARRS